MENKNTALPVNDNLMLESVSQDSDSNFQAKPSIKKGKPTRIYKKKPNLQNSETIYNGSFWSDEENIAYKNFIKSNMHLFAFSTQQRRLMKINKMISKVVKTRSSDQCRSHHQKMLKYHGDLKSIVAYIEGIQQKKNVQQSNKTQTQKQSAPKAGVCLQKNFGLPTFYFSDQNLWDSYEIHRDSCFEQ